MNEGQIRCEGITRIYNKGQPNECRAINGIDLTIDSGEYASIIGPSGSGKSTLLNLISCLDTPSEGEVFIEGMRVRGLGDFQKAKLRREKLGFVFQQFNLIPTMTAAENIELPMRFTGAEKNVRKKKVADILSLVGLEGKGGNRPGELSGGQQQRVAVARALANDPKIILADEPTGNLDQKTGKMIMELLIRLNRDDKKTLVIITHDKQIADECDRVIRIQDGKII